MFIRVFYPEAENMTDFILKTLKLCLKKELSK